MVASIQLEGMNIIGMSLDKLRACAGVVWANWVVMRAAHTLMGNGEQARAAFDFRLPAAIPLYRGDPWLMPAIIKGFAVQDLIAGWRARR